MDVKEITLTYLKKHGFDGLYQDAHGGCACKLDDLFPCGYGGVECCSPGYLEPGEPGGEYDFYIASVKPEANAERPDGEHHARHQSR